MISRRKGFVNIRVSFIQITHLLKVHVARFKVVVVTCSSKVRKHFFQHFQMEQPIASLFRFYEALQNINHPHILKPKLCCPAGLHFIVFPYLTFISSSILSCARSPGSNWCEQTSSRRVSSSNIEVLLF